MEIIEGVFVDFSKKYWAQRYQKLHRSSHPYSLQMFLHITISLSKKIENRPNTTTTTTNNNNNFDSSMVWA